MAMVDVASGGLTARVVWPGLRVGGRLAPLAVPYTSYEPGELSQWL